LRRLAPTLGLVPNREDASGKTQLTLEFPHTVDEGVATLSALEFDDGEVLTESVAIIRYLDALHPEPPLFGTQPRAAARDR